MTDKELLLDVQTKLADLTPRVDALETGASGSVSHDDVLAVVKAESDLGLRVSNLEKIFGTVTAVPENPPNDSGGTIPTPVTEPGVVSDSHVIT